MKLLGRLLKYLATFAAISSLAAYATYLVLSAGITIEIPDIEGNSFKNARQAVESYGLSLNVTSEEYDSLIPEGHVISQDVEPGTKIKGKIQINVIISKGSEVRLIPSVIGSQLKQAVALLKEKSLLIDKVIHVHSDTAPMGVVIAQNPAPDKWAGEGITLVASKGAYKVIYYCPFFIGMTKDDALMLAAELGLNVKIKTSGGSSVVLKQSPKPGVQIKAGDTVTLRLGEG